MSKKRLFLLCTLFFLNRTVLFSQEKIYFLHIPKTGGVTVASLLEDQYSVKETDALLRAYGTHYYCYDIKNALNEYKFITFLRHPIARVLSDHRYLKKNFPGSSYNLQVHFLPPEGDPIDTASNIACKVLSKLDPNDSKIPIERHLESAKKTLTEDVFFLGITEKMNESIEMLFGLMGWELPEEIPLHNSTDSANVVYSQEVLNGIAERNWADIELYEYALKLFEEQKKYLLKKSVPKTPPTFVDSCCYTFDQKLNGYGWGRREIKDNQEHYRWITKNNKAGINFYLNTDHSYTLECCLVIQPIFLHLLRISVNGVPIPFENLTYCFKKDTKFTAIDCKALIPQELLKEGEKTTITFEMLTPENPQERKFYEKMEANNWPYRNYSRGKVACRCISLERN